VSESRIAAIRDAIAALPPPEPRSHGRVAAALRRLGEALRPRWAVALGVAVLSALIAYFVVPPPPRPSPPHQDQAVTTNVWIVDPTLDGAPGKEFDILRATMEENLLKVAEASDVKMQILNDEDVERQLVNLGCPDITKKFKIPDCAEKKVIDYAQIRAKVEPTFRGSEDGKRALALRIGKGAGAEMMPRSDSLKDANLTTLADWSAEQIAVFLTFSKDRITAALGRQRENSRLLED